MVEDADAISSREVRFLPGGNTIAIPNAGSVLYNINPSYELGGSADIGC